jgi:hypothetical protein
VGTNISFPTGDWSGIPNRFQILERRLWQLVLPERRFRVGDVFEFRTPCGLSYLQHTMTDPLFGDLIRVLPNVFACRPPSVDALVQEKERYFVFFPVAAADL